MPNPNLAKILAHRAATKSTVDDKIASHAPAKAIAKAKADERQKKKIIKGLRQFHSDWTKANGPDKELKNIINKHLPGTIKDEFQMNEDTEVDNVNAAIEAMLDGNRIKFGEYINAALHARAIEAVGMVQDEMRATMFNDSYAEEVEDGTEEANETNEAETTGESDETETVGEDE